VQLYEEEDEGWGRLDIDGGSTDIEGYLTNCIAACTLLNLSSGSASVGVAVSTKCAEKANRKEETISKLSTPGIVYILSDSNALFPSTWKMTLISKFLRIGSNHYPLILKSQTWTLNLSWTRTSCPMLVC
jgi:hypothetical protein